MTQKRFSSFHNHSYYSLLDGIMSPEEVVEQAANYNFKSVSLTEHGNMFSMIEGYKAAKKHNIKYVFGCEVYETTDIDFKEVGADRYHLILLAKSEKGLKNLFQIVSAGYTRGFYGKPRVDLQLIKQYSEDIVCLSACLGSRIDRLLHSTFCRQCRIEGHGNCEHTQTKWDEAVEWTYKYKEVFGGNYYLEMQAHDTYDQEEVNKKLLKLAQETNTKFTITFDTHLHDGSELRRDLHNKFLLIGEGREGGETYEGCWQSDIQTIHDVMDKQIGYGNVELGIDYSDEIGDMCNVEIELHKDLMPHIEIPEQFKTEQKYLQHLVKEGWKKRGFDKLSPEVKKVYRDRILNEFEVLDYLGYCGYFIMLYQLIAEIRNRDISLGYSRGSGANSLTLYTLGVTEVDSIRWNLDFSRFANKGRKGSAADYDIDISKARRQEALEIAAELFGEENIAQLATFNSLSPKVCVKDLGKVFDEHKIYTMPYAVRDKIAKLIPDDPNKKMTIERALESSSELQRYAEEYPLVFEYTKYLQNLPKSVGCHAAAVIIAPSKITDYAPVMYNKNGNIMMQLEMHNAMDDLGLVKMDFLGLATLDVVDDTLKLAKLSWNDINLNTLDLDDKRVFEDIYQKGNTLGVFQMEAYVAQDMFKEMKADNINDIYAVNAMNRPAVLSVGMHKEYINNKLNKDKIKYLHDDLIPVMKDTHGVMLYQEQALKVFGLAGFNEESQDGARRSIGKKKLDVMKSLYEEFDNGLKKRSWTDKQVEEMWKLIEAQAGYSFNLGHSTAYGLLSYVTAWLKCYYAAEFMTALLISEIGDYEQTSKYINECHQMGIKVLQPDINKSETRYTVNNGTILFGFESIKGVGESASEMIIEERNNGDFTSLQNLLDRCNLDSSTVIALIKSGAFGMNKDELLLEYALTTVTQLKYKPPMTLPAKKKLLELGIIQDESEFANKELCLTKYGQYKSEEHQKKQEEKTIKTVEAFKEKYMDIPEMYEYETLSIFINGNPFDDVISYFTPFNKYEDNNMCVICGTITSVKRKKQKNGGQYAYMEVLTPLNGIVEGVAFNKQLVVYQDLIKKGSNIVILAEKNGGQFKTKEVKTLEQWKLDRGLK